MSKFVQFFTSRLPTYREYCRSDLDWVVTVLFKFVLFFMILVALSVFTFGGTGVVGIIRFFIGIILYVFWWRVVYMIRIPHLEQGRSW